MRKLVDWFVRHLIWPLLRAILIEVASSMAREVVSFLRDRHERWKAEDESAATTESERAAIRAKYERRAADLTAAEAQITASIPRIVDDALMQAEPERDRLLEAGKSAKALPP